MTVEDCVHGYFLLKGAILGGSNAMVGPDDDYSIGMSDTYTALKELILNFEGRIQQCRTTNDKAYGRFRAWLSGYNDNDHLLVFDIREQLDRYERED